jgi:hypothetical protein
MNDAMPLIYCHTNLVNSKRIAVPVFNPFMLQENVI